MIELEKIVCWDFQVVWQERIFGLWIDEEQKKKIHASFSVTPQTAKCAALAPDKLLMILEKALNFWLADTNIQRLPHFITLYNNFNVGNVLLCVIYQWKFTVFMYVTRI